MANAAIELRVGHIGPHTGGQGMRSLVLDIAWEKGFFQREGVHPELLPSSMEELDRGRDSGDMDIIRRGPDPDIVASVARGGTVKVVAAAVNKPSGDLIILPSCRSFEDLRGKALGVIHPALGSTLFLRHILLRNGLARADYTLKTVGETSQRYAALKAGQIVGALLVPPESWHAQKEGFTTLASLSASYPHAIYTGFQVNQRLVQGKRKAVVGFFRALVQAHRWVYSPDNRGAVLAGLEGQGYSPEIARRAYAEDISGEALARDCMASLPALQQVVDILADLGEIPRPSPPASQFLDGSYLEEALASLG